MRGDVDPAVVTAARGVLGSDPAGVVRLVASRDEAERKDAARRFRELPAGAQAVLLRALLWSDDADVALGASLMVPAWWLTADEAARAAAAQLPHLFDVDPVVRLDDFANLVGSAEIDRVLEEAPPLPRGYGDYLTPLRRSMGPAHVPALAELTICDDALIRQEALDALREIAERTDRSRADVATAVLGWPGGVPMRLRFDPLREKHPVTPRPIELRPATGGYPPLLAAVLERLFVARVEQRVQAFEKWAWRWACAERAAAGDLPLVAALAQRPGRARQLAARAAADLGDARLLELLSRDVDPAVAALAWLGRARTGDAHARDEVCGIGVGARFAAWLELEPDAAIEAWLERAELGELDAMRVAAERAPFRVPKDLGERLAARAVARGVGGAVLAGLAERFPGARTRGLAAAWLARLDADSVGSAALAFLEVADRDGLVARLRELDDERATWALARLGDGTSAARVVAFCERYDRGEAGRELDEDPRAWLGAVRAEPVAGYLDGIVRGDGPTIRATRALAALEESRGVCALLARGYATDLGWADDEDLAAAWPRLQQAATDATPGATIAAWLAVRDIADGALVGLGTVRAPAAVGFLRRAADEREHGLCWWAAIESDPDEVARANARQWFLWLDGARPELVAAGADVAALADYGERLGMHWRHAVAAQRILDAALGEGVLRIDDDGTRPPQLVARAFFAEFGARLRPSGLAGHLVVGPD